MARNGETVAAFEREFAAYVGARYAIALCNGTATLHTALVALGVKPGDRVAVPPLTMSATTIAVLHAGAVPVFCDVDERTWLMREPIVGLEVLGRAISVSLYGLSEPVQPWTAVDDAAQTLRRHDAIVPFTSYSFQASKILPLGEGGMLVTDDEALATRAREFSSLGYRLAPDQPRIDPATLKSPTFERHHSLGWNYRMNDVTAKRGLRAMSYTGLEYGESEQCSDALGVRLTGRQACAALYRDAIADCDWLTPQHVPDGWSHDYWTYAVATDTPERCLALLDAVERNGGERPYPAWRLTYHEPAFRHLASGDGKFAPFTDGLTVSGFCPVAESLQPRLVQFQTNSIDAAERNAHALRLAIAQLS